MAHWIWADTLTLFESRGQISHGQSSIKRSHWISMGFSDLPTALQYYILLFSAAIAFRAQVEKFCFFYYSGLGFMSKELISK